MTTSKNSHAHSYSFSKFNQTIASARLYYKQGAFAKAFDTYIVTHKNTGFELESGDILTAGQCLVSLLEQSYEDGSFCKSSINYLCQEIDKLQKLHINEHSIEFIKEITLPLLDCVKQDLERNKSTPKILWAYRQIIGNISNSCIIPIEIEKCLDKHENGLVEEIMHNIKRRYEQQLYTMASIHAEKEIQDIISYYPQLGQKLLDEAIILFKKHDQCPQRLIDRFSKVTNAFAEDLGTH